MIYFSIHAARAQDGCLLTNGENELPFFQGYTGEAGAPDRRIHHQHQAIIPSYKFNCCGNITEWGVDLNPDKRNGTFDFILQVWRPSSLTTTNETKCYSLVDYFITKSIHITQITRVAIVTPNIQDQLHFQCGDVLGFYVESHGSGDQPGGDGDNGVVLLSSANYTSELVWFASVDVTAVQPSQSDSCPYPVGTNGVLNSSTHAAPVISISMMTTPCRSSHTPFTSNHYFHVYPTSTNLAPTENYSYREDTFRSNAHLIGISVAVLVVIISLAIITAVIMTALYYAKRKSNYFETNDGIRQDEQSYTQTEEHYVIDYPKVETVTVSSMKLQENQAYGTLASIHGTCNAMASITYGMVDH